MKDSTKADEIPELIETLFKLLEAAPEGLSSGAAVSAGSRAGVGGAVQFWATDGHAGVDGVGDGGGRLECLVSFVQPEAV